MLVKTAAEVQQYLPQNAEFEFNKLKPFIRFQGEPHLIRPHLGKKLFDKLNEFAATYNIGDSVSDSASDETAMMVQLLEKVQYPLVNYSYLKWLPFSAITLGKAGASRRETTDAKTPFEYQMIAVENSCHEAAWDGIEDLLLFLEENIDEEAFSDWKDSDAYLFFKECFINTAKDFSRYYNIGNSRRTFLALREMMMEVEDTRIKSVLGEDFYEELKTQIAGISDDEDDGSSSDEAAADTDALTEENEKLIPLISRAVANLTIAKAAVKLPVRISAEGLQLISTSDRMTLKVLSPAETDRLSAIIKEAEESGENYLKQLNDFLYDHIDDYDTFKNSDTYVDPTSDSAKPADQSGNGIVGF